MSAPFDAACGEPVHRLEPCPSCGEIIEDGYCQNCRDIAPARKADDLRPDLRDRVDAIENAALLYNGTAHDYQRGLGNRQDAAREELMALVESLARDLQRAEGECEKARAALPRLYHVLADHLVGVAEYDLTSAAPFTPILDAIDEILDARYRAEAERAECARLLLLRETEIEEGDAALGKANARAYSALMLVPGDKTCGELREAADRWQKMETDLAAARAECEKADQFGTRAELARLKLAGELAAAHDYIRRTHAALGVPRCDGYGANLGEQTLVNAQNLVAKMAALRERLAQAREALRRYGTHGGLCAIYRGILADPPADHPCDCGLAALLAEEEMPR